MLSLFKSSFGDNALTCVEAGIMAPVVGTIGTLQAIEAIKLLTGYGETLHGKVLIFDAMRMQFREFKLPKIHTVMYVRLICPIIDPL